MNERFEADETFAYEAVEYLDIPPMNDALSNPPPARCDFNDKRTIIRALDAARVLLEP